MTNFEKSLKFGNHSRKRKNWKNTKKKENFSIFSKKKVEKNAVEIEETRV